jgi:2-polyprenyl-3-methyl-5-hydroxy-6-metoxy-1,4-benzoquinol methylase
MTFLDKVLQKWRIAKTRPFLPRNGRVLDIGSADGALFQQVDFLGPECLGIDPTLSETVEGKGYRLISGEFPRDMPPVPRFAAITMLAVLEHFPENAYDALVEGCCRFLEPGGRVIITVPSPAVDNILNVLLTLRLVHGMSLEQHHGYQVDHTIRIFKPPAFHLLHHSRFQAGLNHLFVFERTRNP